MDDLIDLDYFHSVRRRVARGKSCLLGSPEEEAEAIVRAVRKKVMADCLNIKKSSPPKVEKSKKPDLSQIATEMHVEAKRFKEVKRTKLKVNQAVNDKILPRIANKYRYLTAV